MNEKKLAETLTKIERRLSKLEKGHDKSSGGKVKGGPRESAQARGHCTMPDVPPRTYTANVSSHRLSLLIRNAKKWVNGTELRYYFFERGSAGDWVPDAWIGADDQKEAVREAFGEWKNLEIGLRFAEIDDPHDAEVKITFDHGDGSWSYVGRDVIDYAGGADEPTMNFGWDLTTPYGRDTALHEIGHTLGFPHEHQSPNAGIVWDVQATLDYFAGDPNYWPEAKTRRNVIDKLPRNLVSGSEWDPDSIMHYEFPAGVILEPDRYRTQALLPDPGLSDSDIDEVRSFYPSLDSGHPELRPFEFKRLDIGPGEQANHSIAPETTRWYEFRTFGRSDTVMVLFENQGGELRYRTGDDDSGRDRNASFSYKLVAGRTYVLRTRLYWAEAPGGSSG